MIAALLPLALQIADPHLFAPPRGRAFVVTMEQVRSVAARRETFRSTRTVLFRRETGGLLAEITVDVLPARGDAGSNELFAQTMRALAGQTMRFHLDAEGHVVSLDDIDAHWSQLCEAIAAIPPSGERFAAPLRAFPRPAQLRFLATMLDPILPDPTPHPPGQRPVSVEARAPTGAALQLDGRERVARRGDGTVQVSVDAQGDDGQATVTLRRRDVLDPATGLRVSHEERRQTALLGSRGEGALTIEERWTIVPR